MSDGMTHEVRCLLFVIGTLEGMRREGWISGRDLPLTGKGLSEYAAMQESGFAITREEVRMSLRVLNKAEPQEELLDLTAHCAGAKDWNGDNFGGAA